MLRIDDLIIGFDKGLRTVFAQARSVRPIPGEALPEADMDTAQRAQAAALMRVNHSGEICAQALYQGQAMTARDSGARAALEQAAQEETEHLAWSERRINELGGGVPLYATGGLIAPMGNASADRSGGMGMEVLALAIDKMNSRVPVLTLQSFDTVNARANQVRTLQGL